MAYLSVNQLFKSFNSDQVLKGVSLELEKGSCGVIIGGSGNGKTTLLRCLSGLEIADSGTFTLGDKPIFPTKDPKAFQSIGVVFQNFNLFPQYTALQNITLALDAQIKCSIFEHQKRASLKEEHRKAALELLNQMGLADKANQYPCELSGGQKQRIAIARALAKKPELLLFDEPTSALDPKITKDVASIISQLRVEHTILVVTHDMSFAESTASKLFFMNQGQIELSGTPKEVFENPTEALSQFLGSGKD